MIVKRHDVDLPEELVGWAMVDGDWKISSVIEATEFTGRNVASLDCASFRGRALDFRLRSHLA